MMSQLIITSQVLWVRLYTEAYRRQLLSTLHEKAEGVTTIDVMSVTLTPIFLSLQNILKL